MLKIDKLQLDLIINGDESRLQLSKLRTEAADLRKEMKGIKDQELLGKKQQELSKLEGEIEKVIHSIGLTGLSMKELNTRAAQVKLALNNLVPGTSAFKAYQQELKDINTRIAELRSGAQTAAGAFGKGGFLAEMLGVAGGVSLAGLAEKGFGVAKKLIGDAVESTKASGDKWHEIMTGMKWGYDEFLKTLATGDWSNFFTNVSNAVAAGQEFERVLDNLKMRTGSQQIISAEAKEQFTDLWNQFNDGTLTTEKRIETGKKAIEIERTAMEQRVVNDKIAFNAEVKHAEVITKLGAATIQNYIKDYQNNQELINQSREYLKLQELIDNPAKRSRARRKDSSVNLDDLKQQVSFIPEFVKQYAGVVKSMDNLNDTEYKDFVDKWVKKIDTVIEFNTEIRRLTKQVGDLQTKDRAKSESEEKAAQAKAQRDYEKRLNELKKAEEGYNDLMKEAGSIQRSNFAEKLSQTEQEIKVVNDKYNNEINKLQEFKTKNSDKLTPQNKSAIDTQVGNLEIARDAQVKQVLEQSEIDFAEKVKEIHEALRVARMTITNREVYEINKKYDDLQKEILDAIEYRYQQELKLAGESKEKIAAAEKNKADSLLKIDSDISALKVAREQEIKKAIKSGEHQFQEDLKNLKIKSEIDLADAQEKIKLEVDAKYRNILEKAAGNEIEIAEVTAQKEQEIADRIAEYKKKSNNELISDLINTTKAGLQTLSTVYDAISAYENQQLQKDTQVNDQKKLNLKQQLDHKVISQKQYDAKVAKMDLDLDAKKKEIAHKQAVRQKEIAVFNATIALLQAIIQAANIAPPADIIMPIIIAALMGVQLAALIATPVPQAAKGRYNVTGKDDGKQYSNVPYQDSFTGIPGQPMLVNETGREIVIDPHTTRNIEMNYPGIIDAINYARVPQRASGQYTTPTSSDTKFKVVMDPEYTLAMKEHTAALKKPSKSYLVWQDLYEADQKMNVITKDTTP